jgi:hypothetical protein
MKIQSDILGLAILEPRDIVAVTYVVFKWGMPALLASLTDAALQDLHLVIGIIELGDHHELAKTPVRHKRLENMFLLHTNSGLASQQGV